MGKSVYGYKGCAQSHPRDQPLFGRPQVRLLYEMENYSANRHKDIYLLICSPSGRQEKLDWSCLAGALYEIVGRVEQSLKGTLGAVLIVSFLQAPGRDNNRSGKNVGCPANRI